MQFYNDSLLGLLWLLGAIAFIYFYSEKKKKRVYDKLFDLKLLRNLAPKLNISAPLKRMVLFSIAFVFLVLALARPQWGQEQKIIKRKGVDIVFVLDTSLSMLAEDIKPNRFQKARMIIESFLKRMKGDRVGLVTFAGSAFLSSPLTMDYAAFELFLDGSSVGIVPEQGTNLGEALSMGLFAFPKDDELQKVIILMTDGEQFEGNLSAVVKHAKDRHAKVYCIGLGTAEGAPIPLRSGQGSVTAYKKDDKGETVITRLQDKELKKLAETLGGKYYQATPEEREVSAVLRDLQTLNKKEFQHKQISMREDHFQIFILIAFFFLLLEDLIRGSRLRARPRVFSVLVPMFIWLLFSGFTLDPMASKAGEASEKYKKTQYDEALSKYREAQVEHPEDPRLRYNIGTTLYKKQDYQESKFQLDKALKSSQDQKLKADAYYNEGNVYYRMGDLDKAISSYEKALELDPRDQDSKYNLELTKKKKEAAAQQEEQQKNKKDQKKDNKDQKDQKDQDKQKQDQNQNKSNQNQDQSKNQQQDQKQDQQKKDQQNQQSNQSQQDQKQGGGGQKDQKQQGSGKSDQKDQGSSGQDQKKNDQDQSEQEQDKNQDQGKQDQKDKGDKGQDKQDQSQGGSDKNKDKSSGQNKQDQKDQGKGEQNKDQKESKGDQDKNKQDQSQGGSEQDKSKEQGKGDQSQDKQKQDQGKQGDNKDQQKQQDKDKQDQKESKSEQDKQDQSQDTDQNKEQGEKNKSGNSQDKNEQQEKSEQDQNQQKPDEGKQGDKKSDEKQRSQKDQEKNGKSDSQNKDQGEEQKKEEQRSEEQPQPSQDENNKGEQEPKQQQGESQEDKSDLKQGEQPKPENKGEGEKSPQPEEKEKGEAPKPNEEQTGQEPQNEEGQQGEANIPQPIQELNAPPQPRGEEEGTETLGGSGENNPQAPKTPQTVLGFGAQAPEGGQKEGEKGEGVIVVATPQKYQGEMSEQEALKILNALQSEEKQILTLRRPPNRGDSQRTLKDW